MISVQASDMDQAVVREFFELFKTPWQVFTPVSPAKVLLCAGTAIPPGATAELIIHFTGGNETGEPLLFEYAGFGFPVYGRRLFEPSSRRILFQRSSENGQAVVRVGFDLFAEIRHLLTVGQPEAWAAIPTLEQHIAFLRHLILTHGLPLMEIPPRPAGHDFIVCLTHDVDHVGIRNHKFDHTMFGFLWRATAGSVLDVARGRKTVGQMAANWSAAAKLPFVHLGLAKDFWFQFDRYVKLENGSPSTFFVIPKKGEPGLDANGRRPAMRAASYDARDLKDILRGLEQQGKEVGVHGLDAWRDAIAGAEEKKIISEITAPRSSGTGASPVSFQEQKNISTTESGVRMHWLYFGEQSYAELEKAGFTYDSTSGYNGTVGYRAGTAQVFRPLMTNTLLELPMHVMDTALFYPSHLNLSPREAEKKVAPLIANADRFGGVLTVNWHDRSVAPERLWDDFYAGLIGGLKTKKPWFATAAQTVGWFRRRRAAKFVVGAEGVKINVPADNDDHLPPLRVRTFEPGGAAVSDHPLE